MYKNLSPVVMGVSGRQSELIELALTYQFRGLDVDVRDMVSRARGHGVDQAVRFLTSAKIKVGSFDLPVEWQGTEEKYRQTLDSLPEIAEIAAAMDASGCRTVVPPATDAPYNETFEKARQRLAEIATVLAEKNIWLGLSVLTSPQHRSDQEYPFIYQAEALLTLIKTVGAKNVGLSLDTWEWHMGEGGRDQLSELSAEQIVAVYLADAAPDTDPHVACEEQRLLPCADGLVDNIGILSLLAEINYEGPVSLACHPKNFVGMTRDAIVQKASSVLDDLWMQAGISKSGKLQTAVSEG